MRLVVMILLVLAAPAAADRSRTPRKPSAPVELRLDSKAVPGGYQVRLVAIPSRDVPSLELSLAGKQLAFGATSAGQRRELITTVTVSGSEGLDVVAGARAAGRNRAEVLRVGKAAAQRAAKPVTVYTLPDGRQIGEVR